MTPYDSKWQAIRLEVLARDGGLCRLGLTGCTRVADQVDHIVPLSEGGARLELSNLRAACRHCNLRRSAMRGAELVASFGSGGAGPSRRW